jgi:PKD repeat protein
LNVNFFGQNSSDPDGSIVSYSWNFGDGNTSSQTNPSHTYNNVGNYTATLNVTDNNGATNSRSLGINVQSQSPPASNYTLVATPESVAPGSQLTVSWTAPGGSSSVDWIGLFRVGASNYEYGWWQYTDGAPCGSYGLPAPTEPGQYEFRYLLNDGYTSVKTSNVITVGESNPNSTTVIFVNNISMPIANRRGRAVVTVYGNDGLPRPNLSVAGNWSGLSNSASTAYLTAKIR